MNSRQSACLCLMAWGLRPPLLLAAAGHQPPANAPTASAIETLEARLRAERKKQIAREEASARKKTRNAVCAFSLLQVVNFLARSAFQIHSLAEYCPQAQPGEGGFNTPQKTCLVSAASLITSMSQIATGLSLAANACQDTLNVDALCAAPIAALFSPATQLIAASTVASAACAKESSELPKDIELDSQLPKDIEFDRRLQEGRRFRQSSERNMTSEARRWQIGECVIDATSAVMALGQLALAFNAATKSCPVVRGADLQEEVSRAACTVDVAFTFFHFSRLVLFIALAVEHCAPGAQSDSLCVAACVGLVAAGFSFTATGAAIYLNCQVGEEKDAIINGSSILVDWQLRRLNDDDIIEQLSKEAGFSRRLSRSEFIEELARQSSFEKAEDLWLSMGYNFSDSNSAWLKDDPQGAAVISRGRQMIEKLQTSREEPSAELLEYGPEEVLPEGMPEGLIDREDEDATLGCSAKGTAYSLDLPGHSVSLEQGVAACQDRCARTAGCVHFSFWPPQRHCHLHGVLADPVPGQPLWISGPPGCKEAQISKATLRTLQRRHSCYHLHAVYEPRSDPRPAGSIEDCQRRCQGRRGCAHFVFSELDGSCSLAEGGATKLQPVLFHLAGPRHCAETLLSRPMGDQGLEVGALAAPGGRLLVGALSAVASSALLLWGGLAASRQVCRGGAAHGGPAVE